MEASKIYLQLHKNKEALTNDIAKRSSQQNLPMSKGLGRKVPSATKYDKLLKVLSKTQSQNLSKNQDENFSDIQLYTF